MEIKRLIRKNRIIQEDDTQIFSSFKEVFDYCYEKFKMQPPPQNDVILLRFRILDTNEDFEIAAETIRNTITKEACINFNICFDVLTGININEYETTETK